VDRKTARLSVYEFRAERATIWLAWDNQLGPFIFLRPPVQLLYIDESGSDEPANSCSNTSQYFVLGGVAAFEKVPYYISSEIDEVQKEFFPNTGPGSVEFRASAIWNGNGEPWNSIGRPDRRKLLDRVYEAIASREDLVLFGIAMHKFSFPLVHPIQRVCEEMGGHFDKYLEYLEIERPQHGKQRGLMIYDQSKHEKTVQALMTQYRTTGASFGRVKRLAEVPLFTDSKMTRMLQLADFVAYAIFRNYESADVRFLNIIMKRFYQDAGRLHGLCHLISNYQECYCAACLTRRTVSA
jgi:hypothetical protein